MSTLVLCASILAAGFACLVAGHSLDKGGGFFGFGDGKAFTGALAFVISLALAVGVFIGSVAL